MTEREIFLAALDLPDPAARTAFLDRACASAPDLRAGVEALLHAHDAAGSFLGTPAVGRDTSDNSVVQGLGDEAPCTDLTFLTPSARLDSLGRLGHYEVLEVLGRGGFGIVLRAHDDTLQRIVALKVLAPHLAVASPARKRFLREARSSARVRHENVVQVYAVEEQPLPYLVMEYIPGETLQQRLDRSGPLDPAEVACIASQIAEGLAAAHATGLIHRDIKPGNIILETGPHSHVKITDFGLARTTDDATLTQSGLVAGTPQYMAPEQAKGETLDQRADLFSLGSVMYAMVSGRPPFRAPSTLAVLKRVAEDTPRSILEIIPEVPAWLCEVIGRLHAKRPEDRIATAREVADLLSNRKGQVRPSEEALPSGRNPASGPSRGPSRRWLAPLAGAALLAVAGLGTSEATGVSDVRGAVIRLFTPHGTLVVEVDDPAASVTIDGEDVIISGAGVKELRLRAGKYRIRPSKDGQPLPEQLVTVERNGRRTVRVTREAPPIEERTAWERSVAALPAEEQIQAVKARWKKLNPAYDGEVEADILNGQVVEVRLSGAGLKDLSPLRPLKALERVGAQGRCTSLTDLSGLQGLRPTRLSFPHSAIADLTPLKGMLLTDLDLTGATALKDLGPLRDVRFKYLSVSYTAVTDLTPLRGQDLIYLGITGTKVRDLSPLAGMSIQRIHLAETPVADLSPLAGMPLYLLDCANTPIATLTPLKAMSELRELYIQHSRVNDLTPLRGLPLTHLNCSHTLIKDLTPLKGMKLTALFCDGTAAPDLSGLTRMALKELNCRGYDLKSPVNRAVLRSLTALESINSRPAAAVLKELEANERADHD